VEKMCQGLQSHGQKGYMRDLPNVMLPSTWSFMVWGTSSFSTTMLHVKRQGCLNLAGVEQFHCAGMAISIEYLWDVTCWIPRRETTTKQQLCECLGEFCHQSNQALINATGHNNGRKRPHQILHV
jgi:hypothetical protein